MQSTDLTPIVERLDAMKAQLDFLTERQRKQEELLAELTPIARTALATTIQQLDELERKGYFAFARELGEVLRKVVDGISPAEVHQLGDAVVQILHAVKAMTQPAVLAVAADAAEVVEGAADVKPLGLFGMVRATKNDDVQKGMAIILELLRRVGHGANVAASQQGALADKKARLQKLLGARKARPLGVERRLPAPAPAAPAPAATCASPSAPQPTATVIDGVGYTADGHLADAAQWTRPLAEAIAELQGVTLDADHWAVLDAARADFAETGLSPNIRRLTQICGVTTKHLYTLFPRAPGRTIAKIAGLPKPAGCL